MPGFPDDSQPLAPFGDLLGSGSGVIPAGGFVSFDGPMPSAGFSHLVLYYTVTQRYCNVTMAQAAVSWSPGGYSSVTLPLAANGYSVSCRNYGTGVDGLLFESAAAAACDLTWFLYGANGVPDDMPTLQAEKLDTPGANTLIEDAVYLQTLTATNNTNVDGQYVDVRDETSPIGGGSRAFRISLRAYETKHLVFPNPGLLYLASVRTWNSGAVNGDVEISGTYRQLR